MEDYVKTANAFMREIDTLNRTVPKDKYITACIVENGEELYISKFIYLDFGVVKLELIKETSIPPETSQKNDYCHLPPDKVLLAHISSLHICFEYISTSELCRKPMFRVGFQPQTD